jgi:hypothetical protein
MDRFDLVVAAMSFHWVDQELGLPKLGRVVRAGGWVALWWTRFGDQRRDDPFGEVVATLLDESGPDAAGGVPFEVDLAAWENDLGERAGLVDTRGELLAWEAHMDARQARAFYASTIAVLSRAEPERTRILERVEEIATVEFGGVVTRQFVTAIYTGLHP